MTSSYSILRVGFIIENRKPIFIGKPNSIVETETPIRKLVLDPVASNVLYYTSQNVDNSETYQLNRVFMSHLGSVLENRAVEFGGNCKDIFWKGILPEFSVFKSEGKGSSVFFVQGSTFDMYQGSLDQGSGNQGSFTQGSDNQGSDNQGSHNKETDNQGSLKGRSFDQGSNSIGLNNQGTDNLGSFDKGSISKCELITSMGNGMIKDLSFSRSRSGDQVFWINTTDLSV